MNKLIDDIFHAAIWHALSTHRIPIRSNEFQWAKECLLAWRVAS